MGFDPSQSPTFKKCRILLDPREILEVPATPGTITDPCDASPSVTSGHRLKTHRVWGPTDLGSDPSQPTSHRLTSSTSQNLLEAPCCIPGGPIPLSRGGGVTGAGAGGAWGSCAQHRVTDDNSPVPLAGHGEPGSQAQAQCIPWKRSLLQMHMLEPPRPAPPRDILSDSCWHHKRQALQCQVIYF